MYAPNGILLDWDDNRFGQGFALYLFIVVGFQLMYLQLYFIVGNRKLLPVLTKREMACSPASFGFAVVSDPQDIVRIAGLLRAVESAVRRSPLLVRCPGARS